MRVNGRRGAFLIALGVFHVILGASYTFPDPTAGVMHSIGFLLYLGVPAKAAGLAWVASGLAAIAAGFVRPPRHDGWGFQALVLMEAAWACVFYASWIFGQYGRGWVFGSAFAAWATGIALVSGMVSAKTVLRARQGQE